MCIRDSIRLALIKQGRTPRDFTYRKVVELQEDYVRGKYDKILERKSEIQLEEIFDPVFCAGGYEVPLRMLIDGAPGVGKTTLSRNVSQKWAEGKILQEYWLVVLLHLRESEISKAQMVDDFFYHDNKKLHDAVVTFIKETSGKGMLVIFDGFDELSLTERSKKSLFLDVIKGKVLSECAVVVTSRPYASRSVQELQSVNRHIEILGFTDKQVQTCIMQRIDDKVKAKELCSELKDRLDIASICQIPLNCSIVLYVYEQEDYRLPDTLTELYELFILHSLKRYTTRTQGTSVAEALQNLNGLPTPIQEYFDILSKIAFEGLEKDKLVYVKRDIELSFPSQTTCGAFVTDLPLLDLMTSAKSYSSRGSQDTYNFLHLTIQEYLSAFWAAKHLSETEKLDFLKQNLQNDRFYMVLWFFSGITRLRFPGVCSVFDCDLWKHHHIHVCHLLYESDYKSHSLCKYVANHCIAQKELSIADGDQYNSMSSRSEYSRFDTLMIAHFLVHSNCQWNSLTLNLHHVQTFHKVFSGSKSCHTFIKQVDIEIHGWSITEFHEETTSLLDEILQFGNIRVNMVFRCTISDSEIQMLKNNFGKVLTKTKVIHSIYMELGCDRRKPIIETLVEGLAHNSTVDYLKLRTLTVGNFEHLMSLLIKWNSNLKLATLSVNKGETNFCRRSDKCAEFFTVFSKFLAANTSLKRINVILPFDAMNYIDAIQSGLNQNSTLKELSIDKTIVFKRNGDTSEFELVTSNDDVHSRPPPAKRKKLGNSSRESLC